ncbi:MAG: hypothetical protein ACRCZF_25515, partial [Gemmataceae bacterium]
DSIDLNLNDSRSADEIIRELLLRERELDHEKKQLSSARSRLAEQQAELADGWAVLQEGRRLADSTTAELETLAKDLLAREATDSARAERERQVWLYERELDAWHAALVEHEQRQHQQRAQATAALTVREARVAARERDLTDLLTIWTKLRGQERDCVQQELRTWVKASEQVAEAHKVLDLRREDWLRSVSRVAIAAVAIEQTQNELEATPASAKRFRVHQKRWERHFTKVLSNLVERRLDVQASTKAFLERVSTGEATIQRSVVERQECLAEQQKLELAKYELLQADEPMLLAPAESTTEPTPDSLRSQRQQLAERAAALKSVDGSIGVVALAASAPETLG